jgi:hypothetical protein
LNYFISRRSKLSNAFFIGKFLILKKREHEKIPEYSRIFQNIPEYSRIFQNSSEESRRVEKSQEKSR